MSKKETKALAVATNEDLAVLDEMFPEPIAEGYNKKFLPRISYVSQDQIETTGTGKNKVATVTTPAGTFFEEKKSEEPTEDGKLKFDKIEIGEEIELQIIMARKQLRMYHADTEKYTSSPIYDTENDIVPIFYDKNEVARGTPKELQERYMTKTTMKGKPKSALEEERVLYVIYNGEMFTMNIRGTSMYAFLNYARKVNPRKVVTHITSEPKSSGEIEWNQMVFTNLRTINAEELNLVITLGKELQDAINEEKSYYASTSQETIKANDEEFNKF